MFSLKLRDHNANMKILLWLLFVIQLTNCDNKHVDSIITWWERISEVKPLKCQYERPPALPESKIRDFLGRQLVKTQECDLEPTARRPYIFSGKTVFDKWLVGSGKVRFETKKKREVLNGTETGVCVKTLVHYGESITEIIGTFVNGTLEGNAKLTLNKKTKNVLITNFHQGKVHGFTRYFNSSGFLLMASTFDHGVSVGHCWYRHNRFLVYGDCNEVITDGVQDKETFRSLVIDLQTKDVWSGKFDPFLGLLTDVRPAEIENIKSDNHESSCILNKVVWKPIGQEKQFYMKSSGEQVITEKDFCNYGDTDYNQIKDVSQRFLHWHEAILAKGYQSGYEIPMSMNGLKRELSPETTPFLTDFKLLTNITLHRQIKAKMSGSENATSFLFVRGGLDGEGRPHGLCLLMHTETNPVKTIPKDATFGWQPDQIRGFFNHGRLEGLVQIEFLHPVSRAWMTFVNGVIHGPVYAYGTFPILPVSSLYFQLNPDQNNFGYFFPAAQRITLGNASQ